jgi:uncharacterized membrane-anchored protein
MFRHRVLAALAALALSLSPIAFAQSPDADTEAKVKAFISSLRFREGEVLVPEAEARFKLGSDYRYLEKADARRVLEELWGNPPDDTVLGMIVPTSAPLDSDKSWAVVVTFSDEGYVSDEDAAKTDYDELLAEMKTASREENSQRKSAGYGTVELVGWAVPPRYDATSKKLYWAKELKFEGAGQNTLNYDVRVLGRRGFLSLNAVANMSELGMVQRGMQDLLPTADFNSGARYADYNESTDKVAGYGIAALIGGGIAAKSGLLAKIGALLLAGKKLIVFLVVGLFAFIGRLFGFGRKDDDR